jgi:[amino group carrier protein]-L-2-aminoadipate 6-kinase
MRLVIKIGGGTGVDLPSVLADCAALQEEGAEIVLVHGCSAATDRLAQELGIPVQHITSPTGIRSRRTDARMMAIFEMAAASVNGAMVRELQRLGIDAWGMSGPDGAVLRARRKATLRIVQDGRQVILHDDFTGSVTEANGALLTLLLQQGYTPIVAPIALAEDFTAVNVDGDRVAALIAHTMRADCLIIITNVPGVLHDPADHQSLIARIERMDLPAFEQQVTGGMRRKLIGAREALSGGIGQVVLADGRIPQPVRAALNGRGTVIA